MDKLTKIGTSLLPMEDIAELLNIKYNFVANDDKSTDTANVAGILSERIAIAVSDTDRTTVDNALKLNGRTADQYFTMQDAGDIKDTVELSKEVYSEDIVSLRKELYNLINQLAKKGIIDNNKVEKGFYDVFKTSQAVHVSEPIGFSIADSVVQRKTVRVDNKCFDDISVDDYIVVSYKSNGNKYVVKVSGKSSDGETVEFDTVLPHDLKTGDVEIFKSLGISDNGSFIFANVDEEQVGNNEKFITMSDDTYKTTRRINKTDSGLAATFRIDSFLEGYLSTVKMRASKFGNPGALTMYIINEADINLFKNSLQAESDKLILGKSMPVNIDKEFEEEFLTFNFANEAGRFPLLENKDFEQNSKTRYCMIIEAGEGTDDHNYYDILFLQSKDSEGNLTDLQLNNITYEYNRVETSSKDKALKTNEVVNNSDLYYIIGMREKISKEINPYKEGLYSSVFESHESCNNIELSLRIGREGFFRTSNELDMPASVGSVLEFKKDPEIPTSHDLIDLNGIGANRDDYVVIGENIRNISLQGPTSVKITKGAYIEKLSKVYRVGYKVFVKASYKEYDSNENTVKTQYSDKFEMDLTRVVEDKNNSNKKKSDRLIFTGDLIDPNNPDRLYNAFEVQIYWKSGFGPLYIDDKYKEDLCGRIYDLSVSVNRLI